MTTHQRRLMIFCRHSHNARQHRGANATGRAVIRFADRFKQITHAAAVQRRDEVYASKVDKAQTEVEGLFHLLAHFIAQAIPLVDHDNQ